MPEHQSDHNSLQDGDVQSRMRQRGSLWLILALVALALIGTAAWHISIKPQKTTAPTITQEMLTERQPAYLTAAILKQNFILGQVKSVSTEGFQIAVSAPQEIELFVAITPQTKIYQGDSDGASTGREIRALDIVEGSFVKTTTDHEIGSRTRIDAVEIMTLQ
jgi:hypothetical protein